MTVDISRALQTFKGWPVESVCEEDVALAMRTTFFVDDRHACCGLCVSLDRWCLHCCDFRLVRLLYRFAGDWP